MTTSRKWQAVSALIIAGSLFTACGRTPEKTCGSKEVIRKILWNAGYQAICQETQATYIDNKTYDWLDSHKNSADKRDKARNAGWEDFQQRFNTREERLKKLTTKQSWSVAEIDALADVCFVNEAEERVCLGSIDITNVRVQAVDAQTGACECEADYNYFMTNITLKTAFEAKCRQVAYRSETTIEGQPYVSGVNLR